MDRAWRRRDATGPRAVPEGGVTDRARDRNGGGAVWIVSASRRTDIPAFWADWLLARVRIGWAASVNPFNLRAVRVSLRPEDVRALVLWSKDLSGFDEPAVRLADGGHRLLFNYTITGLPSALERHVPPPERTVPAARRLAARFGAAAIQWRYDPVLLGGSLDPAWHVANFRALADRLEGATTRCVLSFGTYYRKVTRNLAEALPPGPALTPAPPAVVQELAAALAREAAAHGMTTAACCTPDACGGSAEGRVTTAACIDAAWIDALYPGAGAGVPLARTRPACGCSASRDIGLYDSCPHGCVYCYANVDAGRAAGHHAAARGRQDPVPWGHLVETPDGALRWSAAERP